MRIDDVRMRRFKLSDSFLSRYKDAEPEWTPEGRFSWWHNYARRVNGRKERFWENLRRVVEGMINLQKYHCYKHEIKFDTGRMQAMAQEAFERAWAFKWLPAGRGMWIMGTDFMYERGSAALNSCAFVTTRDVDTFPDSPFAWAMEALMLGVGVGFDVRGQGTVEVRKPSRNGRTFVIKDDREGWVESVSEVMRAFFTGESLPKFDYSEIRPKGTPLKSFGGTASGPEPLMRLHSELERVFGEASGRPLSSGSIVDAMTLISQCVVSGNVRRSASIAIGDNDDADFLGLKENLNDSTKHRGFANNSVIVRPGDNYAEVARLNSVNGEPGLLWLDNVRKYGRMVDEPTWADRRAMGVNPCGEQALEDKELCNLVETFPANHDSYEDYERTLRLAHLYGKSVTLLDTHWPVTNAVMSRNRRMGISQSGIVQALNKHGHETMRRWCDEGYRFLRGRDRKLSDFLRVPESIKITSVKPSGTVSVVAGATCGIHYPHSKYYIMRQRIEEPEVARMLEASGYPVEKDSWDVSGNRNVVEFPVDMSRNVERKKRDVSAWEQLANAAMWQRWWADNQVSVTVTLSPEEKGQLRHMLAHYEDSLKCVSFLPLSDHGYAQAPYEEISEEEWKSRASNARRIDYSVCEGSKELGSRFCDGESCSL
jgi:adenosylcobalamin-dependent ribonucleoside-triphosphate reductase